nr:Proline transporter 1 [Ipomoea batatas]
MSSPAAAPPSPAMLMTLVCFFLSSATLGTLTLNTPSSKRAFICSKSAFPGRRNWRQNFPEVRSARCHFSPSTSSSAFRSPLIRSTRFSSTSIFTSSFFIPGTSSVITCSLAVSFQSARARARDSAAFGIVSGDCSRILKGSSGGNIKSKSGERVLMMMIFFVCNLRWVSIICLFLSDESGKVAMGFYRVVTVVVPEGSVVVGGQVSRILDAIWNVHDVSPVRDDRRK